MFPFFYLAAIPKPGTTYTVKIGVLSGGTMNFQTISVPLAQFAFMSEISSAPVSEVQLLDQFNNLIAQCTGMTANGSTWQIQPMMNGGLSTDYSIGWNPGANSVVIMANDLTTIVEMPNFEQIRSHEQQFHAAEDGEIDLLVK